MTPFQKYADPVLSARCECRTKEAVWGVGQVAVHLSRVLARDNPRFDFARFFVACGFGEGKEFPDDTPLPDSISEDAAVGARWVTVRRDIRDGP